MTRDSITRHVDSEVRCIKCKKHNQLGCTHWNATLYGVWKYLDNKKLTLEEIRNGVVQSLSKFHRKTVKDVPIEIIHRIEKADTHRKLSNAIAGARGKWTLYNWADKNLVKIK